MGPSALAVVGALVLAVLGLRTGEIAVANDLSRSEPVVANRVEMLRRGYRSMVALPFVVDGSRVGALTLCSRESDLVSEEELRYAVQIVGNKVSTVREYLRSQRGRSHE